MIDSHCHLDHKPLFENIDDVLNRAKEAGIEKLLTICTTLESFEKIKILVNKDEMIFGTYGIHPHETNNSLVSKNEIIKKVNLNKKIIGVGETGLDFYYNNSDKESQIKSFHNHIEAAIHLNIPLVEQILLRFGFTQEELKSIDCRPHLYYDEDENPNPDIKDDYGCLLFASRIDKLKGRWDDKNLIKEARKYKDTPVYYYSEFDLKGTEWEELFPIRYNFADLNLNLRQQMLIKSRAKFNIGYQAGINDAVSKHSNNIILTPYDDIKENIIRNVKYIHFDGKIKQI